MDLPNDKWKFVVVSLHHIALLFDQLHPNILSRIYDGIFRSLHVLFTFILLFRVTQCVQRKKAHYDRQSLKFFPLKRQSELAGDGWIRWKARVCVFNEIKHFTAINAPFVLFQVPHFKR